MLFLYYCLSNIVNIMDTSESGLDSAVITCIIHVECCTDDLFSDLTAPRDLQSWLTLKSAAEQRSFMPLLDIANNTAEGSIPTIFYHRKCRQIFTMKHRLGSGTENLDESTNNEETVAKTKTRRVLPATPSRVLDSTCIFCGKSKYIKKSNTRAC